VIVGHGGRTGYPIAAVMVLLQSLDRMNIQARARNTIHIGSLPTTLPRHSARRMKGEAMDMITTIPQRWKQSPRNIQYCAWRPKPSFGMAHEEQNHGYDYGPHNTAFDIPPPTFDFASKQLNHYSNHNPYYSVTDVPPPTFCPHVTSCDREEEEFQQQLEEATRQSQADYTQKLQEDNRFYNMQWDTIHQLYPGLPSGPGGPNGRFDETDYDLDSSNL
jgi:hypothetical protein